MSPFIFPFFGNWPLHGTGTLCRDDIVMPRRAQKYFTKYHALCTSLLLQTGRLQGITGVVEAMPLPYFEVLAMATVRELDGNPGVSDAFAGHACAIAYGRIGREAREEFRVDQRALKKSCARLGKIKKRKEKEKGKHRRQRR